MTDEISNSFVYKVGLSKILFKKLLYLLFHVSYRDTLATRQHDRVTDVNLQTSCGN